MPNCLTNTNPFFSKSKTDIETFQKISSHNGVFYKLASGSVKTLNRIFWCLNIGARFKTSKFVERKQNDFSGAARQTMNLSKMFLLISEFSINLHLNF